MITLASIAAFSFVPGAWAGLPAAPVPDTTDWYQDVDGNWILEESLVGDSSSANTTGFASLEVADGDDATITSTGAWEVEIEGLAAISLEGSDKLTLDGDLTVTRGDDSSEAPAAVGVLFYEGGELAGEANLSVESDSGDADVPAAVVAGVISNGLLDINNFTGAIEVTNDNTSGVTPASEAVEFPTDTPFGDVELDIEASALAIGLATLDIESIVGYMETGDAGYLFEALLGSTISGELNQLITVVAKSNDMLSTTLAEGDNDGLVDAVVVAGALGVAGNLEDGIGDGAVITSTAIGGTATAWSTVAVISGDDDDDDYEDAMAATAALSVGVGGAIDQIAGDVSISSVAEVHDASAYIDDEAGAYNADANALAIAAAAGVVGVVGDIDGGEDATVVISAQATTDDSSADATGYASALNGAVAVGLGAMVENDIAGVDISAIAESGDATATSIDYDADATTGAVAAAVVGLVNGNVSGSTLTASAVSGDAEADEAGDNAAASSISAAAGVIGSIGGTLTDSTIEVTSVSGDAEAVSEEYGDAFASSTSLAAGILGSVGAISEESGAVEINVSAISGNADADTNSSYSSAIADSTATAYGVAGEEVLYDLMDELPEFVGFPVLPSNDSIESDEPYSTTELAGTITVEAIAGNATANLGDDDDDDDDDSFVSYADALATGFGSDVSGDVSAAITATATAGTAESTTNESSDADTFASATADAAGIAGSIYASVFGDDDDDTAEFSGSVVTTATAGTATATSNDYADADAEAHADGIHVDGDIVADFTADFVSTSTATGGTAEAYSDDESAYAYAEGQATALQHVETLEGDFGGTVTSTATGGTAIADADEYAEAEADADAYAIGFDDDSGFYGDFTADVALIATAGIADAYSDDEDAEVDAGARAAAVDSVGYYEGDFGGVIDAKAYGGRAVANADNDAEALAGAKAYGLDFGSDDGSDLVGDFTADVTLYAVAGGYGYTGNGDGDDDDDDDDDDQTGAWAYSFDEDAEADASTRIAAVSDVDDFNGNFTATVNGTSLGGFASAYSEDYSSDAEAFADAEAYGVEFDADTSGDDDDDSDRSFVGNYTGDVTLLATGGVARSVLGDDDDDDDSEAYAGGNVALMSGLDLYEGALNGSVDLTANGGEATALAEFDYDEAYANADADVNVLSLGESFEGSVDIDATLEANGGIADAESYYVDASATAGADINLVAIESEEGSFIGNIDGSITALGNGGTADVSGFDADAYAGANLYVVDFDDSGDFRGDVNADIDLAGFGGFATANGYFSDADAYSDVIAINQVSSFEGDFNADATLYSEGGDATSMGTATALAYANANAEGVYFEGKSGEFVGNFTGSLAADAIGGSAYASTSDYGFNDIVEGLDYIDDADSGADASAEVSGIGGNVVGQVSGDFDLNAEGGIAEAEGSYSDSIQADASAVATGVDGSVDAEGTAALTGSFILDAIGGTAVATMGDDFDYDAIESDNGGSESIADASGDAFAVDGEVIGDVSASFDVYAEGGIALASNTNSNYRDSLAYGDAAGIYGLLTGDFTGDMTVEALGGTALVETRNNLVPDLVEGFNLFTYDFADASAIASGIGDDSDAVVGNIGGSIDVIATGGTVATLIEDSFFWYPQIPDVIESEVFINEAAYNAYAQATGVSGNVLSEEVSAEITATATGGTVILANDSVYDDEIESDIYPLMKTEDAGAFAAGIAGNSVVIGNVTGGITATATPGVVGLAADEFPLDVIEGGEISVGLDLPEVPELDSETVNVDSAFAAGIMTYDAANMSVGDSIEGVVLEEPTSLLDVVISTYVHTFVEAPEGYELSDFNSYAAAVYSGQGDDIVALAEGADIIGDINTGGGANTLTVTGNTIMEGNILSTSLEWIDNWLSIDNGAGTVDFGIDSGFFTAVRTVNVSDLADTLVIAATGGLAPILSQNPEDGDSSLVSVGYGWSGATSEVLFEAGSTILPVFAEGVDLNTVVGNQYVIVDAEGNITDNGALVDNSETPFEYVLEVRDLVYTDDLEALEAIEGIPAEGQEMVLTVDHVKDQDEEETPGTVQTNQAVNMASQAVMIDISKHAALLRSVLRRPTSNPSAVSPEGPSGPDAEKMKQGEWLSYVSAFGNIGRQDTTSGFAGFDYDTYGMIVGQEKLIGDQLIVGISGGYAKTDIDGLNGSGGGDSELYSGAIYANWFTETWYAEGGFTYGYAENTVARIDFKEDVYRGSYDSQLAGTWLEVGFTTESRGFGFEPYARATYIHGEHEGFTDKGADALVLTTEDNDTDNFKTELGLRMNHEWALEHNNSFLIEVKAAWEHEWGDNGVNVDSSYLGDDSLTLKSAEADEDAVIFGVRAQWRNGDGLSLGFEYEPTFAGNWYNHAFSGTLQYNW